MNNMSRNTLKSLKNKTVTITGIVRRVYHNEKLIGNRENKSKVKILLTDVVIGGIQIDHIWLYEPERYYDVAQYLLNEKVKFRGVVKPYAKQTELNIYSEDYGIERKSRMMQKELYNQLKSLNKTGSV